MAKKVFIISIIAFVVGLIPTIALNIAVGNAEVEYDTVQTRVVSSESSMGGTRRAKQTNYDVVVSYEGKEYKLRNAHTVSYIPGRTLEAYMSDGEIYADIQGIRTSTPLSTVYFIVMGITAVAFFVAIGSATTYFTNKRKTKNQ